MSINNFSQISQNIFGISKGLFAQADETLSNAGGTLAFQNQLSKAAEGVAIRNLEEQLRAGDWQAGIRTEKDLLGKGVSLAKA